MCHIKSAQELLLLNWFDEDDMRHERHLAYHFPTRFISTEDVVDENEDFRNMIGIQTVSIGSHPECRVDEAFLGNVSRRLFARILWKSKRLGEVAYSSHERPLKNGWHPLFVKIDEILAAGLRPECIE